MTEALDAKEVNEARHFAHWVGGAWKHGEGSQFVRRDPASGELVGVYRAATKQEVDGAVRAAKSAFKRGDWSKASGEARSLVLNKIADGILARQEELAVLETAESGKPLWQSRIEIARSAALWQYAAGAARGVTGSSFGALSKGLTAMTIREAVGTVAIITPWNFPFLIISQKLPFALAAGCTCVVKPSELTPATTLLLGEICKDAGMPDDTVNIVAGLGASSGEELISHPDIDLISFTGSTRVGQHAMETGAKRVAKVALELGGKNAHIVFADADFEAALDAVLHGAFANAGQSCNCGSRLIIEKSIAPRFIERLVAATKRIPIGDPQRPDTLVGPIISRAQYDRINNLIASGGAEGAELACGGRSYEESGGLYIEPTIFTAVKPSMRIAYEEIFGPVLAVLEFQTVEEAIELANDSRYGLSAGVWTKDVSVAMKASREIEAGTVWINTYLDGAAELPFGGYKESGIGREVGLMGVEDFMEVKTIQIRDSGYTPKWIGPKLEI